MDHSHHGHHEQAGSGKVHNPHHGHSEKLFRDKFWLSAIMTIIVLAYSPMIQHWLNFTPPDFNGSQYLPFILGTFIYFYGGLIFLRGAVSEITNKRPGMMTLVSLAITVAYIYSVATQFFISGSDFFWELATLVTIMLLGHWLEMSSINKTENALHEIAELLPDKGEKIIGDKTKLVDISQLEVGDKVLVRPGSRIPVDGRVYEGQSAVDEAAITGEFKLVNKAIGDEVSAGTLNQDGVLNVEVTKLGDDTTLAGVVRLVAEASKSKSQAQVLADKAAFYLTIIAIMSSVSTFIVWLLIKDINFALERAVTVLIITCPHALGLAVPLVVSISAALSAKNGILIYRRIGLEAARKLDVVLFDKTGTLTKGEHGVADIVAASSYTKEDVLRLVASLEQGSEHAVGKAIVYEAKKQKVNLFKFKAFKALPGLGITGIVQGKKYIAAGQSYIEENNVTIPQQIKNQIINLSSNGHTVVHLIAGSKVIGAIGLMDIIKPESSQAIDSLAKMGIQTIMITGDSDEAASHAASQMGVLKYFSQVKPEDKAEKVRHLKKAGLKVAMVGDGINDAPALAAADIGIAMGAGTDIAIKSADIILVKSDPRDVVKAINLSKATYKKMLQNLVWATGYNVLAIPLAAGLLAGYGIILSPAVGAVLMSVSTIIVALNAQLLRRVSI